MAAGYDTRAYRLAQPGVTFYEVDLPSASVRKQKLVEKLKMVTPGVRVRGLGGARGTGVCGLRGSRGKVVGKPKMVPPGVRGGGGESRGPVCVGGGGRRGGVRAGAQAATQGRGRACEMCECWLPTHAISTSSTLFKPPGEWRVRAF